MAISQQKRILYFSPHQDDEILSMGIDICNSVKNGQDVHIILCTDGSKCSVRQQLADGRKCDKHVGTHDYMLTEEELTAARDKEFWESCRALGVADSNVHILQERYVDRKLTVYGSRRIIKQCLVEMGSDCVVCTIYPNHKNNGQHRDHKALGYAAVELFNEGYISELRLFTESYYSERFCYKTDIILGECRPVIYSASKSEREAVKEAAKAYSRWEPEIGRFAVGYHDIAPGFDTLIKSWNSYCHICIRDDIAVERAANAGSHKELIVCLTSDSSRINRAVQVLGEIYEQRVSPDAVFLWLPSFGFPCREKDLPKELVRMISENGLSIRWCEKDVELHDTYFLTLQDYPDALVVMVEDDINCHEQITEKLYHSYLLHPQDVSAAMIVCTPVTSALADKQRELDAVKNGWSFKIGRVITWLPRKLRGGYRCWREHGLNYTLKRCWEKLKNV